MRLSLSIICISLAISANSQNKVPTPPEVSSLKAVEKIVFDKINSIELREREIKARKPGRPNYFAEAISTDINCHSRGTWEMLYNDLAIWRLSIVSKGAHSLNFGFSEFFLPENAELYIYSPDYQHILGPFSQNDNEEHLELWTPIIEGQEAILELQIPQDQIEQLKLRLSKVNHDFMDIMRTKSSGSCNLDVVCGVNDGWPQVESKREIIQSVGGYTLNGLAQCTGFLVNNTRNDCTPYFMTANHCEISEDNAQTVVVYWNFQNSICRQPGSMSSSKPGDGNKESFNTGSRFIAGFNLSDFTLIELDDPVSPDFNPYFAGWNIRKELPSNATCIHHPGLEEKRISFDFDTLEYETSENSDTTYLRVLDWDIGTTEGGSSGAPLFDQNNLIVGQLTGGQAACSNNLWDSFGWLRRSWEGGGSPESRLKDWLDPDHTGVLSMNGKNCSFSISLSATSLKYCVDELDAYEFLLIVGSNFSDSVILKIIDPLDSLEVGFNSIKVNTGDSTKVFLSNLMKLNVGKYILNFQASDGQDSTIASFFLDAIQDVPDFVSLISPGDSMDNQNQEINFKWNGSADFYSIQISSDSEFQNIILEKDKIFKESFISPNLSSASKYYWRIRGSNLCGAGPWSTFFSFTIGQISCNSSIPDDLPQVISEMSDVTIESVIDFPYKGKITDVNVEDIRGRHSWVSDLSFYLKAPDGTQVKLLENICNDEDDFNLNFDDETGSEMFMCPLNEGQTYKSVDPLSVLKGKNPQGPWTLIVIDGFSQDGGSLDNWEIQICADLSNEASVISSINSLDICDQDNANIFITATGGFSDTVHLEAKTDDDILNLNFDSEDIIPNDSTILRVSNLSSLEVGQHVLVIVGTEHENSDSLLIIIERLPGPDGADILSPDTLSYHVDSIPSFEWSLIEDANNYIIQLADDSNFSEIILEDETTETRYQPNIKFNDGVTYYWRVISMNNCGQNFSSISYFKTKVISNTLDLGDARLNIFPNPFRHGLFIRAEGATQIFFNLELFDIHGRVLIRDTLNAFEKQKFLDGTQLPTGMYFLKIISDDGNFIIEKVLHHN